MENVDFGFIFITSGLLLTIIACINVGVVIAIKGFEIENKITMPIFIAVKRFVYLCTAIVGIAVFGWLATGAGLIWKMTVYVTMS